MMLVYVRHGAHGPPYELRRFAVQTTVEAVEIGPVAVVSGGDNTDGC